MEGWQRKRRNVEGSSEEGEQHRGAKKRFKGVQRHVCNNDRMHPRNKHRHYVDFNDLAEHCPFLKPHVFTNRFGQPSVDFRDTLANRALTQALLLRFYNLKWRLPKDSDALCPSVPSRANYVHCLADLLSLPDSDDEGDKDEDRDGVKDEDRDGVEDDESCVAVKEGDGLNHAADNAAVNDEVPLSSGPASAQQAVEESVQLLPLGESATRLTPQKVCGTFIAGDGEGQATSDERKNEGVALSSGRAQNQEVIDSNRRVEGGEIEDAGERKVLRGRNVKVLDIGVGANCIYPLLGVAEYGWSFVGTESNVDSLAHAKLLVSENALEDLVDLRMQPDPTKILEGVVGATERFCLTMCNPPFNESVAASNFNPARGKLVATSSEVATAGGEEAFIMRIFDESEQRPGQSIWFSSLVARLTTLKRIRQKVRAAQSDTSGRRKVEGYKEFTLYQGKQTRWVVAWTWMGESIRRGLLRYIASSSQ